MLKVLTKFKLYETKTYKNNKKSRLDRSPIFSCRPSFSSDKTESIWKPLETSNIEWAYVM